MWGNFSDGQSEVTYKFSMAQVQAIQPLVIVAQLSVPLKPASIIFIVRIDISYTNQFLMCSESSVKNRYD